MNVPIPTVELQPMPPDMFDIALRWRDEDGKEFGVHQAVATTAGTMPILQREQLVAIESIIQQYAKWVNENA